MPCTWPGRQDRASGVADLEDAAFRLYLPMARTLAHTVGGETRAGRVTAEQAAELGLAYAVLAWRQRTSGGFRDSPGPPSCGNS